LEAKERKKGTSYNDDGTASIDLRFDAANIEPAKRGNLNGRIMFSFSSDPESLEPCFDVERSMSDPTMSTPS